ncbi:DNA cytosine methyltransferase [Paludibaculum fermentans]|uniref:DNA (cytosine-5-)-methyltransferase n=1 Tax=Paludibaculum fermentans TaxID=1473598 RepID=A0A7S7NQU7_PALFE|nr:DNA cytosine methyltransferase [Paludibaculum fermentans]
MPVSDANESTVRAIDLFAGVGGSSCGAKAAGVCVVAAIDAWELAGKAYKDNNPDTEVYTSFCEDVDPASIERQFGRIELLLASPECTSHTCAKGAAERSEKSRGTAFQVVRFAEALTPRWIVIENVIHMRAWTRYQQLIDSLEALDYRCLPQVLNSADFGVPQSRRRLFIVCERGQKPPEIRLPDGMVHVPVRSVIDTNGTYKYNPLRADGRAAPTLERADRAIANVGTRDPFLIVYYGSDGSGGWQPVSVPLRTITTLDRFAYVRRRDGMHEMRMLQVPELQLAMGFPKDYILARGTRRDRIKLLGNAVCPPVMEHVVRTLVKSSPRREMVSAAGGGSDAGL